MLQLIDRPAGIVVDGAAHKFDCAARAIWRGLRVLQEAGFPLFDDRGADGFRSIWRLNQGFTLGLPVKLQVAGIAGLP